MTNMKDEGMVWRMTKNESMGCFVMSIQVPG